MKQNVVPIFFAVDSGYVPYLSVAIASLIENASKDYNYDIHVVYQAITEDAIKKLKMLETPNAKIILTEMKDGFKNIIDSKQNLLRNDFFKSLTIYFRIFIPFMFKEYDKAIYIDSDTCVVGDISELYNYDLKDNLFGGCKDISCQDNKILCEYFKENAGVTIDKYINSGVLLMNMKKLREVDFQNHFLYLLNKYHFDTVCPDQDYINAMASGKIMLLSNEWDAMPTNGKVVFANPKIIHYNLFSKPWHYGDADYADYFWHYANKSLFKDEILKEKNSFTEENKRQDEETFASLVSRAEEITHNEVTFKKVFESGQEERI